MSILEIEHQLAAAQRRLKEAMQALAPVHKGGEWEEYHAAYDAVLILERELAAARGEEHAVPLEFPFFCDAGAPFPYLIQNASKALLTFRVRESDPDRDSVSVTVKNPKNGSVESLALVEFCGCISTRLGSPNDEVFEGHPLSGKGLKGYTAQRVINSRWLAELEAINSVHHCYDPDRWRNRSHYVFWFHDTTFECVAESFTVEVYRMSMAELLARACQRLVG